MQKKIKNICSALHGERGNSSVCHFCYPVKHPELGTHHALSRKQGISVLNAAFLNQLLFALKKTRKCQRNPAVLLPQFLLENLEVGKLMLEPVRLSQSSLKLGAGIECLFCCVAEGPSLPRGP